MLTIRLGHEYFSENATYTIISRRRNIFMCSGQGQMKVLRAWSNSWFGGGRLGLFVMVFVQDIAFLCMSTYRLFWSVFRDVLGIYILASICYTCINYYMQVGFSEKWYWFNFALIYLTNVSVFFILLKRFFNQPTKKRQCAFLKHTECAFLIIIKYIVAFVWPSNYIAHRIAKVWMWIWVQNIIPIISEMDKISRSFFTFF